MLTRLGVVAGLLAFLACGGSPPAPPPKADSMQAERPTTGEPTLMPLEADADSEATAPSPAATARPDEAPPRVEEPLRVGGDVSRPVALQRVQVDLPARLQRVGPVILEAVINETGAVEDVRVLRDGTEPPVGPLYADALRRLTFRPAMQPRQAGPCGLHPDCAHRGPIA